MWHTESIKTKDSFGQDTSGTLSLDTIHKASLTLQTKTRWSSLHFLNLFSISKWISTHLNVIIKTINYTLRNHRDLETQGYMSEEWLEESRLFRKETLEEMVVTFRDHLQSSAGIWEGEDALWSSSGHLMTHGWKSWGRMHCKKSHLAIGCSLRRWHSCGDEEVGSWWWTDRSNSCNSCKSTSHSLQLREGKAKTRKDSRPSVAFAARGKTCAHCSG